MYKCMRCKTTVESLPRGNIRCPNCAYRIFFKVRQPVVKKIKAR
ncbi:MAG: DNA-directed RNA polymerase subunit P [Candidatus Iainarchaeum archaeon]|uniref:DNA-directed RNA polymerase subunit Rpo12 n=1 Tax=Candidatus Iainarchaeum sp. TaxID=3101447 RepID=A0A497JIF3_9ARCH|nr:MAG: DNA-directed RNA polymerase subunit P [Candidatus Diapherotrites archaeon]